MIIENPDAFKSWLTSILEPLCDADPAALAKYVYALVKKDKPLDELRDGMLDQLDVFLQQETRPFVDMLFKSLETHEYLKPSMVEKKQPSPPPESAEPEKEPDTENHGKTVHQEIVQCAFMALKMPPELVDPEKEPDTENHVAPAPAAEKPAARPRADSGNAAHRVVVPRSRPHPHHEQTLIKLLPTELLEEPVDPPRRRERRTDSLRDKEERRRRRSRSWERRARPRRAPRDPDHERRRPPSRSPSPRGRYRNRSPPPVSTDRHTSRSRSRSPGPIRDREMERERDRVRASREIERDRMSRDRDHRDRVSRSRDRDRSRERSRDRSISPHGETRLEHTDPYKRRCRDFDVKGYCMRGDLCEWDHGVDPVVLEDATLTRVLAIPPPVPVKGYCMRGDLCEWDHGVDPVVLEDATLTRVLAIPPPVPEYNPAAPDIWGGGVVGGFAPPSIPHLPHMPHHLAPRELVPIPRVRHEPPMGATMPPVPRHPAPVKKNFDFNRLGSSRPPLRNNSANCSLEVKKVPPGLNDITHLNNHFCKFGKIVNIQVCYEGDPEGALITFSNPTEANVAYKSTEAVLNNRFIKVFWHNPENKQENTAPGGAQAAGKPAERGAHAASHNKVLINRDNIKATADTNRLNADRLAKETANGQEPKKEPVKRVDTSKQVQEMHRRAQALLQTQLRQQKLLIERLETGNGTEQQKAALMEAINASQEGIEKLRKELVAYNGMAKQMQDESVARSMSRLQLNQANAKKPKTPQEAQKEILDAELDIITKQQEGQDVTELAKKIAEMRRQMALQFPTHAGIRRPHSRGGRFNSAMRYTRGGLAAKGFSVNQSVDHRPRALLVSGFEPDELDALQAHFAQFGEITGKEVNLSVPELVVQYRARAHAEQALLRARHYNDRTLSITWVTNNKALSAAPAQNGAANNSVPETKEVQTPQELSEDALLRFDEEEEDEEDRSWRR